MREVKRIARGTVLVASALWFALSCGTVWATADSAENAGANTTHMTAEGGQAQEGMVSAHEVKTEEHAAGEHGAAHHDSLSPAKIKDFGLRVMNFIALMIILIKFGAKPIAAGLSSRRNKIKTEIEDLEARKAEAEKTYKDFEAKLASVEKDIDSIVEKAVAQATIEKARIIEKAEQAAADIQRQAELAVQREVMEARRKLKNEIADHAAAMAEELIIKNLTAADQVKIVEDYLIKVEAVQ
ncbi:MAG: ATP synthase F0 subunit B [Desulfocapsaceae bacterium]|nr:ATP synthase F0 subunit B [Desulfocapsaceae bacterium]